MIMPGRMLTTLSIPGGTYSGTTQVNGYTLPTDLTLTSRASNQPTSYVASDLIDLNEGFESGLNDNVTAYIAANKSVAAAHNGAPEANAANTQTAKTNNSVVDPTKNRVKLHKETVQKIKENQPRNETGQMIDPNTKKPLTPGQIDMGHKLGQEWHKRREMHKNKGSTRKEVSEAENDPNLYHLEDRSSNQSHKYEQKQGH